MAADDSMLARLDLMLDQLFSDWNIYTSLIATLLASVIGYALFFNKDPDTHPFLLARQASEAPVRQPGESAELRALDVPPGYPLKSSLGVRDPDTPKWSHGRRGDLRDIWKTVVRGTLNKDGSPAGKRSTICTVLGDRVQEHKIDDISQEINIVGQYIRDNIKVDTVAVCLPNSVELLALIFAGAFYGFKIAMIPEGVSTELLAGYVEQVKAQLLITEAGTVAVSSLLRRTKSLKHAIWVVKQGSRHMGWNEVPAGIGSKIDVAVWHELVNEGQDAVSSELPTWDPSTPTPSIAMLWSGKGDSGRFIEYTPANLVAGIVGLGSSLPHPERLNSSDLVLSIDTLSHSYTLCLILAALYVNASIALNSVAGEVVDFDLATAGISPTVVITSSHTISDYHAQNMGPLMNPLSKLGRYLQTRTLDAGRMPSHNMFSSTVTNKVFQKLRLLFISHRADGARQNQLTSLQLTDLRVFTGVRVVYALTGPNVAGAICQSNPYDYRRHSGYSHFGPPVGSVSIKLIGHDEKSGGERAVKGEILVSGPAVVSEECKLGIQAELRDDLTLVLSR
ncbi:hypothetical protein FQN57_001974 [Myotisia sp. PD_48]|nr:hypothetical protein FQN57_001974 [Myotisia sp. PD_48]